MSCRVVSLCSPRGISGNMPSSRARRTELHIPFLPLGPRKRGALLPPSSVVRPPSMGLRRSCASLLARPLTVCLGVVGASSSRVLAQHRRGYIAQPTPARGDFLSLLGGGAIIVRDPLVLRAPSRRFWSQASFSFFFFLSRAVFRVPCCAGSGKSRNGPKWSRFS